jgi:hypothetical protein
MSQSSPENSRIYVTLKEFIESMLTAQDKLLDEKLRGRDGALSLQAKEYERRLEDLNHEHQKNQDRNRDFVGTEKFESFEREFRQYKESNDKAVEAKAKSLSDQVDQKATAAIALVEGKAGAIAKEFSDYKTSQATAVALAAGKNSVADPQLTAFIKEMKSFREAQLNTLQQNTGATNKMSTVKATLYGAVGIVASGLWALSLAVGIYFAFKAAKPKASDDPELTRLRTQQTEMIDKFLHDKPAPTPEPK